MDTETPENEQRETIVTDIQQEELMGILEDENGNEFQIQLKELLDFIEHGIPFTSPLIPVVQSRQ